MKCFVRTGLSPIPKIVDEPSAAIVIAEKFLEAHNNQKFSIYWRRDDLYPQNFVAYSQNDLLAEIQKEGEATLQLAKVIDGLPVMGETVTIYSAEEEERNAREADLALKNC
jgi:hypothetical protein